jgi:hypothetical protein
MVIVTTNISDKLITRTINCTNAREVWLSIEAHFQSAAARNKYSNRNKFNRTELLENETIDELAETIRKLTFQLRSSGERISEADQLTSLLGAVEKDERFISITTSLESDPDITFEQAVDKLLAQEARMAMKRPTLHTESALYTQTETRTCNNCHRIGHLFRNCPEREAEQQRCQERRPRNGKQKYSDRSKKYFGRRRHHANQVTIDSRSNSSSSSSNEEEYALHCTINTRRHTNHHNGPNFRTAWEQHCQLEQSTYVHHHHDLSDWDSEYDPNQDPIKDQLFDGTWANYNVSFPAAPLTPEQIASIDDRYYDKEVIEALDHYYAHLRGEVFMPTEEEMAPETALMTQETPDSSDKLCLDSGCTKHVTNDINDLDPATIVKIDPPS